MWIINWLPEGVILFFAYAMLLIGAGGYIVSKLVNWIPFIARYKFPLEVIGILMFGVGAQLHGGHSVEEFWQAKVKQLEQKVAEAEAESKKVTVVIETKVVTKIKKIKETVYVNKEIIKEVAGKQLDSKCELPVSTVVLHNSASQNEVARGAGSTDGSPSDVKASELLTTVVENYGTCYEMREKLLAWQEWHNAQKKIFENIQK